MQTYGALFRGRHVCSEGGEKIPHRIAGGRGEAGRTQSCVLLVVPGNVQTPKPSSYALTARSGGGADSFEVPSKPQAGPLVSAKLLVLGRTS